MIDELLIVDSVVAPMPSFDDLETIVSASGITAKPDDADASAHVPRMCISRLSTYFILNVFSA